MADRGHPCFHLFPIFLPDLFVTMRYVLRHWTMALFVLGALLLTPTAWAQQTIDDARSQGVDAQVTVEGTVTRAFGAYVRLQDDSGPTGASALVIRQTGGSFRDAITNGTITRGTQLQVSGALSEFNGLLQINGSDLDSYNVLGTATVPAPQSVTLSDLATNGEDYESELVTVEALSLSASGTFANQESYTAQGGAGTITLRIQTTDETTLGGTPIPSGGFTYTGVVGDFRGDYQLIPVRESDLQPVRSFRFGRPYALAEEGSGTVSVEVRALNVDSGSATVTAQIAPASTATNGADVGGFPAPQTLTFTGPTPTPQTLTLDVLADAETEGVERLEVELTTDEGAIAAPGRFTLWVLDDATAQGPIAEGKTGTALLDELQATFGDPPTLGYDVARDTLFATVYGARGDSLRGVYTGFAKFIPSDADPTVAACSFDTGSCFDASDINTEHAWPQSLGAGDEPARSNLHILFPTRGDANSARSNFPYGSVSEANADRWFLRDDTRTAPPATNPDRWSRVDTDADRFEPRDAVKGDVARALFYFATIYPDRADRSFFQVQKAPLFQWHQDDPVDAAEARRNVLQASYQDNQLNPFVIDPTLVDRAYGQLIPPADLAASSTETSVDLDWTAPRSGFIVGYNVYRAEASFASPDEAIQLTTSPLSETSFSDTDIEPGRTYVYRVTAVTEEGEESALSDAAEVILYPSTVRANVTRPFGSLNDTESYRLVALPGAVNRSLATTLNGNPGDAWQAYWDDGSDQDFLVPFDNSDRFDFRPGRGFWLLNSTNWTVAETFPTIPIRDGAASIPLHDGWNIISNPFDVGVPWAAVVAANGGTLQPIWAWSGTAYDEAATFTSARGGEAFYFLNAGGLDALTIPYTPSSPAASSRTPKSASSTMLQLSARVDGKYAARVRFGTAPGASAGRDAHDIVAPPMTFQTTALYAVPTGADTASSRGARWALDARASGAADHTFDLALRATPGTAINLHLGDSEAFAGANVVLVDLAAGTSYDLRTAPSVTLTPTHEQTALRVLVGDDAFVAAEQENLLPETLRLHPNYPNPFRTATTLTYDLPSASPVRLAVYDILGRRVQILVDERKAAGRYTVRWNGRGVSGQSLASGIYFVRLRAGDQKITQRLTLVR